MRKAGNAARKGKKKTACRLLFGEARKKGTTRKTKT
jgi:hypothetical protein